MDEIVFIVEAAPEGGYTAHALGHCIITEADTLSELKDNIRDAVKCHFGGPCPAPSIRLRQAVEEVISP